MRFVKNLSFSENEKERNFAHKKKKLRILQKIIICQSVGCEMLNVIAEQLLKILNKCILFLVKKHNALRKVYVFSAYKLTMKKILSEHLKVAYSMNLSTLNITSSPTKKKNGILDKTLCSSSVWSNLYSFVNLTFNLVMDKYLR